MAKSDDSGDLASLLHNLDELEKRADLESTRGLVRQQDLDVYFHSLRIWLDETAKRHQSLVRQAGIDEGGLPQDFRWRWREIREIYQGRVDVFDKVYASLCVLAAVEETTDLFDMLRDYDNERAGEWDLGLEAAAAMAAYEVKDLMTYLRAYEIVQEEREIVAGRKSVSGALRGGRRSGRTKKRDEAMAREFLDRRGGAKSDSAIKEEIGRERGLKRSAAIDAVNRGLNVIGAK